jgi:hypothetical protein
MIKFRFPVQILLSALLVTIILSYNSCQKDEVPGEINLIFQHNVNSAPLVKDSLMYVNEAGNLYEVNELQYFISEVTLWKGGLGHAITDDNGIHYVDIDIPATLTWSPDKDFDAGNYDSISFVFGIIESKNQSGLFVNPPERDMFWPDVMGGGYHCMKMNGKWKEPSELLNPFNLHLGMGMTMDSLGNETFIPNDFRITLPLTDCYISGDLLYSNFIFTMEINSWFDTPNEWDWNIIGGQIMQNQDAMHKAVENGRDAFSVEYLSAKPKK